MEYFDKSAESEPEENKEEEKLKFFREFSSRLSPVDRTLVSLYLGDVDYREISQVTGLSEVNARSRIHRIKGQIKKEWEEKNGTR
jgi:RNA polymerase sigma-70 factor (ECF subfamily)